MNLSEIPRGQLSTIILSSLLNGDKYGYEIIESVEQATNGEIVIKKPSLYSTLTRMEKQDLVSSYWQDSDIGGRRHYYRLTDYGKKQVLQWQEQLYSSQSKLAKILQKNDSESLSTTKQPLKNDSIPKIENEKKSETFLKQENLFNLTESKKSDSSIEQSAMETFQNDKINDETADEESATQDYIQYDLFSNSSFVTAPETESSYEKESYIYETKKGDHNKEKQSIPTPIQPESYLDGKDKIKEHEKKVDLFKENINELLKKETIVFEERLQSAKKSFNFETEYKKYLKTTKSYSETFDPSLKNASDFKTFYNTYATNRDIKNTNENDATKSYLQSEQNADEQKETKNNTALTKLHNQFSEFLPNTQKDFESNKNPHISEDSSSLSNEEKSFFEQNLEVDTNQENLEKNLDIKENKLPDVEEQSQNATIITDRIENKTKVKKIAPASFLHLNKNKMPEKKSKNEQLYSQETASFDNEKILKKLDDNSLKQASNHTRAEEYFGNLEIDLGKYNKSNKLENVKETFKTSGKKDYINNKKFNLFASVINFCLILILISAMILVLNTQSIPYTSSVWLVVATAVACIGWMSYSLISYLKNKDHRVLKKNILVTPLWQKIILMAIFLTIIYSVHLIAGLTIENISDFAITLTLPIIFCFNVFVYHFAQLVALRK